MGLEFSFSRTTIKDEITFDGFKLCGENQSSHIASFEQSKRMPPWLLRSMRFSFRQGRRRQSGIFRATRCSNIRDEVDYWRPFFERNVNEKSKILKYLDGTLQVLESGESPEIEDFDEENETGNNRQQLLTTGTQKNNVRSGAVLLHFLV
jgi:hypothetical protein